MHGAVAFARGLRFEPHEEFAAAAVYLGEPAGQVPIEFGRDGVPFYAAGPYGDARAVVRTLEAAVGEGNHPLHAAQGVAGRLSSAAWRVAAGR